MKFIGYIKSFFAFVASDEKSKKVIFYALIFIFLFRVAVFFPSFIDPDFYWHLRTGGLIVENKEIPKIDWYSHTMPDFPWVDHEWLGDVLLFILFQKIGYSGIILIFYLLLAATFLLAIWGRRPEFSFWPVFFATGAILPYCAGPRPQMISWFFIVILIKILFGSSSWISDKGSFPRADYYYSKWIYCVPFLFLLWANLHGGFALGLAILGLCAVFEFLKFIKFGEIKNFSIALWVFLFSCAATFVNPYGWKIYEEIYRTINDNFLRQYIAEWVGFLSSIVNWPAMFYFSIVLALIVVFYKKITLNRLLLIVILALLALLSARYFTIFMFASFPFAIDAVAGFWKMIDKSLLKKKFCWVIFSLAAVFFLYNYPTFPFSYENKFSYPSGKMVEFLKNQNNDLKTFNDYTWGGYFILYLPEKKIFIDGRMPSWRQNSRSAFEDFVAVTYNYDKNNNFDNIVNRYNIGQFVLSSNASKESIYGEKQISFLFSRLDYRGWLTKIISGFIINHPKTGEFLGVSNKKNSLTEYLKSRSDWEAVYEDDSGTIFEKNK